MDRVIAMMEIVAIDDSSDNGSVIAIGDTLSSTLSLETKKVRDKTFL